MKDVAAVFQRRRNVMGDHDDRHPLFIQFFDKVIHFGSDLRIKAADGLIEKHYLGSREKCPGQQDPLLLASGQLPIASMSKMGYPHLLHTFFCPFFLFFAVERAKAHFPLKAGQDDLPDRSRKILLHDRLLWQIPDVICRKPIPFYDLSFDGALETKERFHERCFSGAVFSDDAEIIALLHMKIQVLHDHV